MSVLTNLQVSVMIHLECYPEIHPAMTGPMSAWPVAYSDQVRTLRKIGFVKEKEGGTFEQPLYELTVAGHVHLAHMRNLPLPDLDSIRLINEESEKLKAETNADYQAIANAAMDKAEKPSKVDALQSALSEFHKQASSVDLSTAKNGVVKWANEKPVGFRLFSVKTKDGLTHTFTTDDIEAHFRAMSPDESRAVYVTIQKMKEVSGKHPNPEAHEEILSKMSSDYFAHIARSMACPEDPMSTQLTDDHNSETFVA